MNWERIIDAANGRPQSLAWIVAAWLVDRSDAEVAAPATLLLLEEAPHPAAALVAAATSRRWDLLPIQAALAPHVAPALAAWRADPQWIDRAVGAGARRPLTCGVARMVGALRNDPAALRDAVAIVLRDGNDWNNDWNVERCLESLGARGWALLDDDLRTALVRQAPPGALGWVWGALNNAQRAAEAQDAGATSDAAAVLIGRIGAAAWGATDQEVRRRLIDAAAHAPTTLMKTAPAWPGMTDDERDDLASAIIRQGDATDAFHLLDDLGAAGRQALTADLRAALERRAMQRPDAWRVRLMRAADAGWRSASADDRAALLAAAEQEPWIVPPLLRTVGVAGWNAMRAAEQSRLAAMVRRTPDDLFCCPPALWDALAGDALPPATTISLHSRLGWRGEDADADLGGLPPAHQTLVLALAPWRTEDATKDSVRVRRLVDAWDALPDDERVALATAAPGVLPSVAAAARLVGGSGAVLDAVGATVARIATATGGAVAKRVVAAMLRTPGCWRAWMIAFAPTDGDPPDVGKAWRRAARRGSIADVALCARLAAKEREESKPSRALRRMGR